MEYIYADIDLEHKFFEWKIGENTIFISWKVKTRQGLIDSKNN